MRHKMGWRIPQIWHDRSCISKSTTLEYNKDASEEATKLVKDFFTTILNYSKIRNEAASPLGLHRP